MNSTHNRKYPGRTPAIRPIPSDSNQKNSTPTTLFGEKLGLERMKFSLHGTPVAGSEERPASVLHIRTQRGSDTLVPTLTSPYWRPIFLLCILVFLLPVDLCLDDRYCRSNPPIGYTWIL